MGTTKKILIVTGGTGGHIYPAVALAQQITRRITNSLVVFMGGGLTNNSYFDQHAFVSQTISCGAFVHKSPWAIFKSLSNIGIGICQSLAFIRKFRPDAVVGFGSFYSFPPLVAAKLLSVPIILHEANSIPGKVNRLLSKYAEVSTVHFPRTLQLLKGNTVEVGMPLREELLYPSFSKVEAKQHYGLDPNNPTILVFGGSQGAQIINTAAFHAFKLVRSPFSVIHLTGTEISADQLRTAYSKNKITAIVKPFEKQMGKAWKAADIVISRAGAGTIAEQLEFEVPGILIPFAAAADNHQEHNANFMVENVGGAKKLTEAQLNANLLAAQIAELLKTDTDTVESMRNSMRNYKQQSRTRDLCSVVQEVIGVPN